MLQFGLLLVPMVLAAPIEFENHYVPIINGSILQSIQITGEPSNDLDISGLSLRGIDKNVFENLTHIKNLNLANNSLSILPESVFSHFKSLEHLSLADNLIESFNVGVFLGLNNLQSLNISNNPVKYLRANQFSGVGKSTNISTLGISLDVMNTGLFEKPNFENKLSETSVRKQFKNIVAKHIENIAKNATNALNSLMHSFFISSKESYIKDRIVHYPGSPYRGLDTTLKVQLCLRDGIVETLEAFDHVKDIEPNCREVDIDHGSNTVSLAHLGLSKFSTGWYRLQDYPIAILDLTHNNIVDVQSEILNDLPAMLVSVDLSNNKIERLVKGQIINQHLRALDFTNNSISEIEDRAFENTNLTIFFAVGNRLRNTRFLATFPSSMIMVTLADNEIEELSAESFSALNQLVSLNVSGNKITEVHSKSLRGLFSLQTLSLNKNNLQRVEPGSFRDLKALFRLILNNNNLTILDKGVFDGLESIEYISIMRNNLTKIMKDTLRGLPDTLLGLDLSGNRIDTLETGTFISVPKKCLFLTGNRITTIEEGSFNLPDLKMLHLSNNSLSKLSGDSFIGLGGLRYLELESNGITKIDKGFAKNLCALLSLDMNKNPIKTLENGALFGLPKSTGTAIGLVDSPIELIQGGVFDDL